MQTNFTPEQLADPHIAHAESIIRKCVHCGFCLATCPTYVELGNELDSPRGRIYLMKEMLEEDRPATKEVVTHIDRCLSCLACQTTCPSGVHYSHLVDQGRAHIERTYRRPFADRMLRSLLAKTLPYPERFRASLIAARLARPLAPLFTPFGQAGRRLAAMLRLAPHAAPAKPPIMGQVFRAEGERRGRVALLANCAQPVLDPKINEATIRLLNRLGIEVVYPQGMGCCGALVHHMGREEEGLAFARANVDSWTREIAGEGLDAILINVSGCGTTIKDYGHLLRLDEAYADRAAKVSELAKDVSEYLVALDLPAPVNPTGLTVAYHSACSLQHGQRVTWQPKALLEQGGFTVLDPPEGHLCCGSAGTYNMLQPEIAAVLRHRKVRNIETVAPQAVAAGNIGCITQIGSGTALPVLHTVELLDWAYGGEKPAALEGVEPRSAVYAEAAE